MQDCSVNHTLKASAGQEKGVLYLFISFSGDLCKDSISNKGIYLLTSHILYSLLRLKLAISYTKEAVALMVNREI